MSRALQNGRVMSRRNLPFDKRGEADAALWLTSRSDSLWMSRGGIARLRGGHLESRPERVRERSGTVSDERSDDHAAVFPEHPRDGRDFWLQGSSRADDGGEPFGYDFRWLEGNRWSNCCRNSSWSVLLDQPRRHVGAEQIPRRRLLRGPWGHHPDFVERHGVPDVVGLQLGQHLLRLVLGPRDDLAQRRSRQ